MERSEIYNLIARELKELYRLKWVKKNKIIQESAIAGRIYASLLSVSARGLKDFISQEL